MIYRIYRSPKKQETKTRPRDCIQDPGKGYIGEKKERKRNSSEERAEITGQNPGYLFSAAWRKCVRSRGLLSVNARLSGKTWIRRRKGRVNYWWSRIPGLQQQKVHKPGQWFGREDPDSSMILGLMGVILGRLAGCHDRWRASSCDIDRLNWTYIVLVSSSDLASFLCYLPSSWLQNMKYRA